MKILVYGVGVIGGCMAHFLCQSGNDVTVLARGRTKETLETEGLCTESYFGKKQAVDHPHIIETLAPDDRYDVIFVVMQAEQVKAVLPILAANESPLVVLVGNNLAAQATEAQLKAGTHPKTVAFGFQATGGERKSGKYTYVAFGKPSMTIGSSAPEADWLPTVQAAFGASGYGLAPQQNMPDWFKAHLAFVLPICYLTYQAGDSLKGVKGDDINRVLDAALEGYRMLKTAGCTVEQQDIDSFTHGKGRWKMYAMLWLCVHTPLGELAAAQHARNAVPEMRALSEGFDAIHAKCPQFAMPAWDALKAYLPQESKQ